MVYNEQGRYADAEVLFERSLTFPRKSGHRVMRISPLPDRG
jgi:hypothetical protein